MSFLSASRDFLFIWMVLLAELSSEGLLNNLQDWELSFKEKDKKLREDSSEKGKEILKEAGALAGSLDGALQEKPEVDKKISVTSSPAGKVAKFVGDDYKANIREVPRQISMENKANSLLNNGSNAAESAKSKSKYNKLELRQSVQEPATKTADLAKAEAAKNIAPPTSAYQFEVSWRGLSGDRELQARL